MSQQQVNAEFKSQRVNLDCRFCFISNESRNNLEYDIVAYNRFHYQIMQ